MSIEQYTYWSITINNPDDNDMLIVRNPNDRYVRQFIWTPEEGASGTHHIQGWLRLQRNQTQKFVQKLYPRAHVKPCRKDEYNENTHNYAQKNDETTKGAHTISINDPLPSIETLVTDVMELCVQFRAESLNYKTELIWNYPDFDYIKKERPFAESELVRQKGPLYAKVFVSPVYERLWERFGQEIFTHIRNKHASSQIKEDQSTSQESRL